MRTTSSSAAPFSSCLQSFPASGSFPIGRLFASGDQSIGALATVLPMNIQNWCPLGLTALISFSVQGALQGILHHHSSKVPMVQCSAYGPTLISIHDYWKNHSFDCVNHCWQSDVSAFVMLFRFLVGFLPRHSHLLLLWLQSLSTVLLEPKKIKSVTDSNTLTTWCKGLTHWKTHWCWERLKAGGEGNDRGWDVITDSMHASLSKFQEVVMDRESWRATVHGVTKSRTWLSDWTATKGCKRN